MLLDLNMPIMNGWQFLDTLIGIDPDFANKLKIVVLSSSVDPKDKEKAADYPNIILFQTDDRNSSCRTKRASTIDPAFYGTALTITFSKTSLSINSGLFRSALY